jgi:Ca-activated chloride channel family protein
MLRASGAVGLSLLAMVVFLVGCGGQGGPAAKSGAKSAPAPIDSPRYAQLQGEMEIAPTSPQPVQALDTESAAIPVELSDFAQAGAPPKNDLMKSIGAYDGTGLSGRGEAARGALVRANGGNSEAKTPAAPSAMPAPAADPTGHEGRGPGEGGDKFAKVDETAFLPVQTNPLSTFAIDVDTASYSKVRSFLLEQHRLPPPDAVRIEELINYFDYAYEPPTGEHPFSVQLEAAQCPWQPKHQLVRIGLQGKALAQRPASNLVFLIDVSGSMQSYNKLPLVQQSLSMLTRQLGENDRVSIVVYAGAAGLVLPPTSGENQPAILSAIENLQAGGSTNGGAGIQLAYKLAEENLIKGGANRVVLCSDGDFNVGVTSTGDLVRMAEEKAKLGVHLAVLGFGTGNHNDAMLEQLANKANGHYAFIDTPAEARKVFVEQLGGTLVTIAQDVKIQVEFNPAQVAAYRLIGYENRRLADRDFNDDTKDAGEIGAGHRVTALYEVVPPGVAGTTGGTEVDPLKYQPPKASRSRSRRCQASEETAAELLTVKLRYQPPGGGKSTLMTHPLVKQEQPFAQASADYQFACSVAAFGMILQQSKYKGDMNLGAVFEIASATRGADSHGYRQEFLGLVRKAQELSGAPVSPMPEPAARPAVGGVFAPATSVAIHSGIIDPAKSGMILEIPSFAAPVWLAAAILGTSLFFGAVFLASVGLLALAGFIPRVRSWEPTLKQLNSMPKGSP